VRWLAILVITIWIGVAVLRAANREWVHAGDAIIIAFLFWRFEKSESRLDPPSRLRLRD
jgi:hypothetical protein